MKDLLPFQEDGARFLASRYHGALGDQPGLGKTIQAIHAAALVFARRVLVVCPASVRSSWREHVAGAAVGRWNIISYNEAVKMAAYPGPDDFDVIIIDEVHFCKNVESQRTHAIFGGHGLARRARFKWCLSGTMAPNGRPVELYPMLKALHPDFKDMTFARYAQRYCGAFWDGRELNVKGSSNIEELATLLKSFMLRRTKREVFPGRRAPLVSHVGVELAPADLDAVRAAEEEIGGREARLSPSQEKFSQLGDTSKLLRLLGVAMAPRVAEFVDEKLEGEADKVVVFFKHTAVGEFLRLELENRGRNCVVYQGGMSDTQKDWTLKRFAGDDCEVFLGQVQAAGTGINGLQRVCSTAVFAEPDWTPGETEQRIDRLDRMGQEDDIVNAYVLYARQTLSEVVMRVHDMKEGRATRLIR